MRRENDGLWISEVVVAVGALTLVTTFALCVRSARLSAIATAHREAPGGLRDDRSDLTTTPNDNTLNPESEAVLAA